MGYNLADRLTPYTNVLHTNPNILVSFSSGGIVPKNQLAQSISAAKSIEQKLYEQFGCNNFWSFIAKLRQFFNNETDRQVIRNFQNENLKQYLNDYIDDYPSTYGLEGTVTINLEKIKNIDFSSLLGDGKVIYVKNEANLTMDFINTTEGLKSVFNKMLWYVDDKGKTTSLKLDTKSASTDRLNQLKSILADALSFNFTTEENINKSYTFEDTLGIPNFPWGLTKVYYDQLKNIDNDIDGKISNAVKLATNEIKDFIFKRCGLGNTGNGVSEELYNAANKVWDKKINKNDLTSIKFFTGAIGDNFKAKILGALGEFMTAVLFQYVSDFFFGSRGLDVKILGDEFMNGEQGKDDIQLMDLIGVQVKNYPMASINNIATNIHPREFVSQINSYAGNLLDFIANYFFNPKARENLQDSYNDAIKYIKQHLAELLNIAVKDSVSGKVSFYVVNGQYLIPCSTILECANNSDDEIIREVEITGHTSYKFPDKNDYSMIQKYWTKTGSKYNQWNPTDYNKQAWERIISKNTSIRAKISFNRILTEASRGSFSLL